MGCPGYQGVLQKAGEVVMNIESLYIALAWVGIGLGFVGLILVAIDMVKVIRDE